jgi:singapore isolate B (sub-type 7) whole genome shotgun sequence assembly, scaffold_7
LETLEFNASDRRNQAAVRQLLHDSVNTASLQFTPGKGKVIIMDEVDGMSAGDRGGMQELVLILFNFYIDSSHSDNACTHHLHLQRSG